MALSFTSSRKMKMIQTISILEPLINYLYDIPNKGWLIHPLFFCLPLVNASFHIALIRKQGVKKGATRHKYGVY